MFPRLATNIRAFGHYIEQPALIERAGRYSMAAGGAAIAGLSAFDILKASPEDRKKVALRDFLVLGATALGTVLATRKFMMFRQLGKKAKSFVDVDEVAEAHQALKQLVAEKYGHWPKELKELVLREATAFEKEGRFAKRSQDDFKAIIAGIRKQVDGEFAHLAARERQDLANKTIDEILPVELGSDGFLDDVIHMKNFFVVGGISVLSGLFGGLVSNFLNGQEPGESRTEKQINMVKEGIFQFIANIALCAVGAAGGLAVVNWNPVKKALQKMAMLGNFVRTGIIGLGLCVGILGGAGAANYVGQKFVTPFFNKLQGKPVEAENGKRKVEFWDAILHLDDLPTALALAGVEIMKPFIPLFFAFSGYRTGIGYRNHEGGHGKGHDEATFGQRNTRRPGRPLRLMRKGSVFHSFYQRQNA